MDRKIEKSRWNTKRLLTIGGITALVALIVFVAVTGLTGKSKYNVPVDRITISDITKGPFSVFIPVNGVVMPQITEYIDAVQGGTVEQRYVEDGAKLHKGDPIVKLSNTQVELNLATNETSLYNLQTQMQISKNAAEQNTVSKLTAMADVENTYQDAVRVYNLDKKLYAQKAIGLQEFQIAENTYNYQLKKRNLTREILRQDTALVKVQSAQAAEQVAQMKNALELMRQQEAALTVKAPIDGQLTSLDAEVGQNKNVGDHLAQIDGFDGIKVQALIDDHYVSQVVPGMTAYYPDPNGTKNYKMVVKKVYVQITNAQFKVDMMFVGDIPPGLRKGQTLQIRLVFSDEQPAILLPRGGFYQQTGGNWIFKVSDDGKTAYRVDIQLNRQNPDYYEVIKGLKPGDKVITSSYENYGDIQELVLTK